MPAIDEHGADSPARLHSPHQRSSLAEASVIQPERQDRMLYEGEAPEQSGVLVHPPVLPTQKSTVKVYISYGRNSTEHSDNVAAFTSWLREQGIHATCDLFHHIEVSRNAPAFIEASINEADFVIAICSHCYVDCWNNSQAKEPSNSITQQACPSNLDLTNYEILLIRNLLYRKDQRPSVIPVQLLPKRKANLQPPNEGNNLTLPVALQGCRVYKLGSIEPKHVLDQRDLLYNLFSKPLYLTV